MKEKKRKILIVDDDPSILEILKYNLENEGYQIETGTNGIECFEICKTFLPDIILLDIMMPRLNGIEAVKKIKKIPKLKNISIVFLTARSEENSEIEAFDIGAEDYIIKPIKIKALIKRIEILYNRKKTKKIEKEKTIKIDKKLTLDRYNSTLYKNKKEIELTKKEFEILELFALNTNKKFSREEVLETIWGQNVFITLRTIDVHIKRLRHKIGKKYIQTIKGVGYKFHVKN